MGLTNAERLGSLRARRAEPRPLPDRGLNRPGCMARPSQVRPLRPAADGSGEFVAALAALSACRGAERLVSPR